MLELDRYLDAATRENTQRSYAAAVRHFEVEWGGLLPATSDGIARYLARYAQELSLNTLRHRLAALARWHADHGFADPTRTPLVKKTLKGIAALHPAVEKQAKPLQLAQLEAVAESLGRRIAAAQTDANNPEGLRATRDRALILLGFWRGFRADDLTKLRIEHLRLVEGRGMEIFLPGSKGDRENVGRTFKVPALSRCCPVTATAAWIDSMSRSHGPLFPAIDRWGHLAPNAMDPQSVIPILRRALKAANLVAPEQYSGHSLRRGFAGWANDNGWDVKTLMEYVGWKDVQSAMRYLDGSDPFAQHRVEASLAKPAVPAIGHSGSTE